jgi:flavin-dependent dehydrogenase
LTFQARYLVDATGRARGVRAGSRAAADRLVACCCYIELPAGVSAPSLPLVEAGEDGWWFSAALPDGTLLVAYFTDADLLPSSGARMVARFWRLLERAPLTRQQLPDVPARHRIHRCAADSQWRPASGPNRLAVGDALMSLDPLSGRGLVAAIESGRGAADALLRCDGGDVDALEDWQTAQRGLYERYLAERDAQYEAERRWPESTFWRRRRARGRVAPDFLNATVIQQP